MAEVVSIVKIEIVIIVISGVQHATETAPA
jgi:hypothetical protein